MQERADRTPPKRQRNGSVPVLPVSQGAVARSRRGACAFQGGLDAEQVVCDRLLADGWTLLGRRLRTEAGEIDIVVVRDRMLAFVEVKARPTLSQAAVCLTARQQARLRLAGEILLARHPDWPCETIRFDLLLVDQAGAVRRIADAFRDEGSNAVS